MFKRVTAHLIILALLLKAAVPAGFMPDMQALAAGVVKITICANGGSQDIYLDHDNKKVDPKHTPQNHHQKDFCAFSSLSGKNFVAADAVAVLADTKIYQVFSAPQAVYHLPPISSAAWPQAPPTIG
jgi:hypothetical protein